MLLGLPPQQLRSDPLVSRCEYAVLGGVLRYISRCCSACRRSSSDRTRWSLLVVPRWAASLHRRLTCKTRASVASCGRPLVPLFCACECQCLVASSITPPDAAWLLPQQRRSDPSVSPREHATRWRRPMLLSFCRVAPATAVVDRIRRVLRFHLSMLLGLPPQQLRSDPLVSRCEYAVLGGVLRYISRCCSATAAAAQIGPVGPSV